MRTVSKAFFALCLFWNVGADARQPYLPDPELTPGDVFEVTLADICTPGYSKTVRAVPKYLRDQAFRKYGIEPHQRGDYQLDHLIPLALGGSNSVRNLWPQPHHAPPWGARAKDRLENRLHRLVCAGKLDLKTAQQEIAADWPEAYRRHVGAPPVAKHHPHLTAGEQEVWVNPNSGRFWRHGAQYFGKTKHGEFMTEAEAVHRGYKPAGGTGR
jgi:hypothetical protein